MSDGRARILAIAGCASLLAAVGTSVGARVVEGQAHYPHVGEAFIEERPRASMVRYRPFGVIPLAIPRGTPVAFDIEIRDNGGSEQFALYERPADGGDDRPLAYFSESVRGFSVTVSSVTAVLVKSITGDTDGSLDIALRIRTGDEALAVDATQAREVREQGRFGRFAPFDLLPFPARRGQTVRYQITVGGSAGTSLGLYYQPEGGGSEALVATFNGSTVGSFVAPESLRMLVLKPYGGATRGVVDVKLVAQVTEPEAAGRPAVSVRQADGDVALETFAPFAEISRNWRKGEAITYQVHLKGTGGASQFALYARPKGGGPDIAMTYFSSSTGGRYVATTALEGLRLKVTQGQADPTLDVTLSVEGDR